MTPNTTFLGEVYCFLEHRLFSTLSVFFGVLDPFDSGSALSISFPYCYFWNLSLLAVEFRPLNPTLSRYPMLVFGSWVVPSRSRILPCRVALIWSIHDIMSLNMFLWVISLVVPLKRQTMLWMILRRGIVSWFPFWKILQQSRSPVFVAGHLQFYRFLVWLPLFQPLQCP